MYLLDTNVVSELRKAKTGKANKRVIAWANRIAAGSLFLSVISILELETGILLVERRDPTQGSVLRSWLENQVLHTFAKGKGGRGKGGRVLKCNIVPKTPEEIAQILRLALY